MKESTEVILCPSESTLPLLKVKVRREEEILEMGRGEDFTASWGQQLKAEVHYTARYLFYLVNK